MKTMTHILRRIILPLLLLTLLAACSEDPKFDKSERQAPLITSFSPAEGKIGTEITIEGEHLEYVDTVYIGGGLATLKYRISPTELVVKVNAVSKTGAITVQNNVGRAESESNFTVAYAVPTISNLPATGKVNDQILIQGTNMEVVSKVLFGTEEATVIYQTEKEMVVTVPYVEENEVTVYLVYQSASGEAQAASSTKFSLNKPQPVVTEYPLSAESPATIEITGENLSLIDQVLFGTVAGTIMPESTDAKLIVTTPQIEETATVALTLEYYGGTKMVLTEAFELIVPAPATILYHANITTYAQEPSLAYNFFNASNGEVYGPCEYESVKQNIDFFITFTGGTVQINNPSAAANQIKNFKCGSTSLPTEALPNKVRYKVLEEGEISQKKYIDLVKNKEIQEISYPILLDEEVIKLNADGSITGSFNNLKRDTHFEEGSVVVAFKYDPVTDEIIQVGLIEVLKVVVNDKSSSWTFNCYWQI